MKLDRKTLSVFTLGDLVQTDDLNSDGNNVLVQPSQTITQITALLELRRALTQANDLETLLQRVTEQLQQSFGYTVVAVHWRDKTGLHSLGSPTPVDLTQQPHPFDLLASQSLQRGQSVWLEHGLRQGPLLCVSLHQAEPALGFLLIEPPINRLETIDREVLTLAAAQIEAVINRIEDARALREQEQLYRTLLDHQSECVALFDQQTLIYFNAAALSTLGLSSLEQALQLGPEHFSDPDAALHWFDYLTVIYTGKVKPPTRDSMRCLDGRRIEIEVAIVPVTIARRTLALVTWRDVTERQTLQLRLEEGEAIFTNVLEALPEAVLIHDHSQLVYVNPAAVKTWRATDQHQLIGLPIVDLLHRDSLASATVRLERRRLGLTVEVAEESFTALDGAHIFLEVRSVPFHLNRQALTLVTCRDVTERREHLRRIETLAYTDALTGIANRAGLEKWFSQLERTAPISLLYIDFDDFKIVNDSFGHEIGDALLVAIAERLTQLVEPGDFVARLAGDEFAVFILGDATRALARARHLQLAFLNPFLAFGRTLRLSASIGHATYPNDADGLAQLISAADLAMYTAKQAGRGRISGYHSELKHTGDERVSLVQDLLEAIESDTLDLRLQPIIELQSGQIVKFEALLHWTHPIRGVTSPSVFVPIAEKLGLVALLDRHVIRKALQMPWAVTSPDLSLNVASATLLEPDFTSFLNDLLVTTGFPATRLWFEITETSAMTDAAYMRQRVLELRLLGVRFALDDFGTGYSTLTRLQQLEVDAVKLDISFTRHIGHSPAAERLLRGTIDLAHSQGMVVIAEGIETEEQAQWLKGNECDMAQGFLYARPEPWLIALERRVNTVVA